jgi:cytoskeletal protein CcmA (bactofilin family)
MKKTWSTDKSASATSAKSEPIVRPPAASVPTAAGRMPPAQAVTARESDVPVVPEVPPKSIVGRTMSIVGDLEAKEDLLISGSLQGTLSMPEHALTLGTGGIVKGPLRARALIVEGSIDGDIDCDSVVLEATARVTGTIRTRRLTVADGAYFNGKVEMTATPD